MSPSHLTDVQLAARWGRTPGSLRNARVAGNGCPFIRIGRSIRYRLTDVLAYEEANKATSTTRAGGR